MKVKSVSDTSMNTIRKKEDLDPYLMSTELCDWDNPRIKKLVAEIIGDSVSNEESALKIFSFIRDQIVFSVSKSKTRASQTLKNGAGECATKTNLHVALLRASGIPARFHRVKCKIEPLRGVVPQWLFSRMPPIASHFWPEAYLSGRWIACEGLLDKVLYNALLNRGFMTREQVPTIEWNGEDDLILFKPWIVEDFGTLTSYEEVYELLDKSRKEESMPPEIIDNLLGWIVYPSFRRYTDRLRKPETPQIRT